jgi:hypothetical protein
MITVDGRKFNVMIKAVDLDAEFMYKFAERTEDFNLNYELGAVFFNQSITFGVEDSDNKDFVDLYKLLTSKGVDNGTGHNVEIFTPLGRQTFLMYPNKVQIKLLKERGTKSWWQDMQIKFIAVKPAESW